MIWVLDGAKGQFPIKSVTKWTGVSLGGGMEGRERGVILGEIHLKIYVFQLFLITKTL